VFSVDCYIPYVLGSNNWTREMDIDCHMFPIHIKIVKISVSRVGQPALMCLLLFS
jgi:hypothetical protein